MYDLVVIGGGAAGMSAAIAAYDGGVKKIIIIDRDERLGGILSQCVHNGFGQGEMNDDLTGPEYAHNLSCEIRRRGIQVMTETSVMWVHPSFTVCVSGKTCGCTEITAKAVVLATGCRERAAGSLQIAGTRPAGIITAGAAQRLVNVFGLLPGKRAVILGSGDIGLIMARRLKLSGVKVQGVVELADKPSGQAMNIVHCLYDYDIPLYTSHTISRVYGNERVDRVTVTPVDENVKPKGKGEFDIPCDCIIVAVGLIPENEVCKTAGLQLQAGGTPVVYTDMSTQQPGMFICGNCAYIHADIASVVADGVTAGSAAARYVLGGCEKSEAQVQIPKKEGTVCPMKVANGGKTAELICAGCGSGCRLTVNTETLETKGNNCDFGRIYAAKEMRNPRRILTGTAPVIGGKYPRVPIVTSGFVSLSLAMDIMAEVEKVKLTAPVTAGQVIIENVLGTGVDINATTGMPKAEEGA